MVRNATERILVIADSTREIETALASANPLAVVTRVDNYFDAIAELSSGAYTTVVAATEPIEHRPQAAVRTLRNLAGEGRIILFGEPALESVSRKMLDLGCDDYIITPARPNDLQQILSTPLMRIATKPTEPLACAPMPSLPTSQQLDFLLADLLADAMVLNPGNSLSAYIASVQSRIAPWQLQYQQLGQPAPSLVSSMQHFSQPVQDGSQNVGIIHLAIPANEHAAAATQFIASLSQILGKIANIQQQHRKLQDLAIKDQLTQVYNRRYFEHFLSRILEKAKVMRFAVTLLLFDIDNFKKYNDQFGHGLGDEILRETAALMKRCCREHDLVARIGGDEFAVVFWEKESPRQPKDPNILPSSRLPSEPIAILRRFHKLISSPDFQGLGPTGQGMLTISGGLASFPWDGRNMKELIEAADHNLVQHAKKAGKNSIAIVGGGSLSLGDEEPGKGT